MEGKLLNSASTKFAYVVLRLLQESAVVKRLMWYSNLPKLPLLIKLIFQSTYYYLPLQHLLRVMINIQNVSLALGPMTINYDQMIYKQKSGPKASGTPCSSYWVGSLQCGRLSWNFFADLPQNLLNLEGREFGISNEQQSVVASWWM